LPHVRDVSKCQDRDDYIEHHHFRVFSDTITLCLCRPALLSYDNEYSSELTELYLTRCRSVLQTYLELLKLQCPVRNSWIFVHVTLSCSLTLAIGAKTQNMVSDIVFLRIFFETLSQTALCANIPAYGKSLRLLKEFLNSCEMAK
jgi:hypothetical protein